MATNRKRHADVVELLLKAGADSRYHYNSDDNNDSDHYGDEDDDDNY
jgi:hypothetical protein